MPANKEPRIESAFSGNEVEEAGIKRNGERRSRRETKGKKRRRKGLKRENGGDAR